MHILYNISVFFHILFAAFWLGGMLFIPIILLPSIKCNPERVDLLYRTGIKFRFYGWISLSGLFITGIYNASAKGMVFAWDFLTENNYGKLLGIKLLALSIMLCIGAVHDFYLGNKAIKQMQNNCHSKTQLIARWSGRINLLLTMIIAFLGVVISRGGF